MSCDELKQKGNDCIRQKNYAEAIEFYTQALGANPSSHAVYSNRSLAYSSVGDFERALQDATKCLEHQHSRGVISERPLHSVD